MKCWFICFMLVFATGLVCSGQCPSDKRQMEVTVSYGIVSGDQLTVGSNDNHQTITYNSGMSFVTARYFLYNRLALGFSGGIASERGQYADAYTPSVTVSTYKLSVTTVALELYYVYLFRKYLEVYTFFGVGPGFTTTTTLVNPVRNNPGYTNVLEHDAVRAQYTPVGVRVGGRLGAFAELGLGYKGVINAGLSFKVGPSCWWRE